MESSSWLALVALSALTSLFLFVLFLVWRSLGARGAQMDALSARLEQIERNSRDDSRTSARELRQEIGEELSRGSESVRRMLEQVHRGLGEMQTLATGVGDLKKVLTSVRARGAWGEVQLGALLDDILSRDQYATNVPTRRGGERVEFALRLPGAGNEPNDAVWLPIDAKFPLEAYVRLVEAQDRGTPEAAETASKQLEQAVRSSAKMIRDKYIEPPFTTDFALLFVPVESLYAEILRRPGLVEGLQTDYRVVLAGPSTLAALLNALQLGFRTLAIQKRTSEVWKVLAEAKTEFNRYSTILERMQKKAEEMIGIIEDGHTRTRAINRKLRDVEEMSDEFRLRPPGVD